EQSHPCGWQVPEGYKRHRIRVLSFQCRAVPLSGRHLGQFLRKRVDAAARFDEHVHSIRSRRPLWKWRRAEFRHREYERKYSTVFDDATVNQPRIELIKRISAHPFNSLNPRPI